MRHKKLKARDILAYVVVGVAIIAIFLLGSYAWSSLFDLEIDIKEYCIVLIYILVCPFVSIYYLCTIFPLLGYIECAIYITLVILWRIARNKLHYPIARSLYNVLLSSLPIYASCVRIYLIIKTVGEVEFEIFYSFVGSVFLYSFLVAEGIKHKEYFYFIVPKNNFTLFLRRFRNESHTIIDDEIAQNFAPQSILRIGDPETSHGGTLEFKGHSFFMPTKKWKPVVEYYMFRAKNIVCKIDTSDGLIWEIFEHSSMQHKTIYCIDTNINISASLDIFNNKGYNNRKLYYCLKQIDNFNLYRPIYINIDSNHCFYSNTLKDIVDKIDYKKNDNLLSFEIPKQYSEDSTKTKLNISFYITDVLRYFTMLLRPRQISKAYIQSLSLLEKIWIIFKRLGGAFFIYNGIITFLSMFIYQIDGSIFDIFDALKELDGNLIGRFFLSCVSFLMGIGCLSSSTD